MAFEPNFLTTMVGSVPYKNSDAICAEIVQSMDIPSWPQMVKKDFRENMYAQFGAVLPDIVIDDFSEKITFDTAGDLTNALEEFYTQFLEDNIDYFGLPRSHAIGFYTMMQLLQQSSGEWVKGQVTGPISMGLTITDQSLRSSLYDDNLADALVKNAVMNARWQIRKLKTVRPNVIIFVDEPYMASFGSAFISLSREQVISMLDEVFNAIHFEGGLAGVHCCANTDWSVLLATKVDILNLDAYGYIDNLALYPRELRQFIDHGGLTAWGIVPNSGDIDKVTPSSLVRQLWEGINLICRKAASRGVRIEPDEFRHKSLITTACGLGSTTPEIADKVIPVLIETGQLLKEITD
jgi:hypothetical protein